MNLYSTIDEEGYYTCTFCGKKSKQIYSEELTKETMKNKEIINEYAELLNSIVDYITPRDFHINSNNINEDSSNILRFKNNNKSIIFLIDGNLCENELKDISVIIDKYLNTVVDKDINIGLIVYDSNVNIYEIGNNGFVSCECYNGKNTPNEDIKQLLANHQRTLKEDSGDFLPPNYVACKTMKRILDTIPGGIDIKNRRLYIYYYYCYLPYIIILLLFIIIYLFIELIIVLYLMRNMKLIVVLVLP